MSSKAEDERNKRKPDGTITGTNNNPACDQCRTRKIRCDRESPSCSNCRKANLPCDFTNKGKRINHTKQLVEDFSFLSGRLESIDASIARITQRLELEALPPGATASLQSDPAAPNDDLSHFTCQEAPVGTIEPSEAAVVKPGSSERSSFFISKDRDGAEIYYGPTAARSLFQQTRFFVDDLLTQEDNEDNSNDDDDDDDDADDDNEPVNGFKKLRSLLSNNPTAKTELRKCNDAFPYGAITPGIESEHDGRMVSRPPQSFVESSLDFFLEEVNTVLPLFDEEHLRAVVKEQYSAPQGPASDAWNLCFNNIIVLVMGIKLKTALSMNVRRRDLEDDIFLPFLANSHRAFNSLSDYTMPRLVNVQALITLALVAADHFSLGVYEQLVHKACALGREMGLERWIDISRPASTGIAIERRRVFWSLYVLDKRRTFLTGKPCELYLAESDLETPKFVQNEMWAKNSLASIHMMTIWEEIWKNLYSSRAMRNSAKFREEQINRLRRYLKAWVNHHKQILERPEQVEMGNATCMRLELRYSFHIAQILVHRCLDKPDNLQQQINNARAALKIIKDISQGPATISGISLLTRLFRCYPVLPFYEIQRKNMLGVDEDSQEDMELMRTCLNALTIFINPGQPTMYYNRLSFGLEWCQAIATVLQTAQEPVSTGVSAARKGSSSKVLASPPLRKATGKRDSDSMENDSPPATDPRSQRRRMATADSSMSSGGLLSGTNTAAPSQNGSDGGPETPASGYFSDFNNIDPFGTDPKSSGFMLGQMTTPSNDLSDLAIPPDAITATMHDSKNHFDMNNFTFNYPNPIGTINPAQASQPSPHSTGQRHNSIDLSSVVARLPPGGQQALTSVPPSATFTPESFSAFNTDLLDDSFTNVDHHTDLMATHNTGFGHFGFDFAPDQIGFGPMDGMMGVEGI